ncbi:hypothetical protein GCL60_16755 [Silvanigrella paludirubra]|uniref:Uncharacterized protein n=2 Tax=Silvanigrella paludirubra TaxID=2499159 RepID=A0A6N6VQE3_9BACT|nr:hypothetical protein GCL60_16755 [Silvanigrella paludirubra]
MNQISLKNHGENKMEDIHLKINDKNSKYRAKIYMKNKSSDFTNFNEIEKELKNKNIKKGLIFFDLSKRNFPEKNCFFEIYYNGERFIDGTWKQVNQEERI